jgi:coenzyme F420-0:L-glutamate ligase/coenzyme F420-1:gamma-L-glutamate ligase
MLSISAIEGLPEVREGMDLGALIAEGTRRAPPPGEDAVLVVAQKVVSKAEGRIRSLAGVVPGERARDIARRVNKDPRLVELILAESRSVIRTAPGVLIVEHHSGHILANAGIDSSNISQDEADPRVLLWPRDPDESARRLSMAVGNLLGRRVAVIINDSIGRPWRYGTVGHAIGCWGLDPLWNQIGDRDRFGNVLRVTEAATADAMAAAAALVQGEGAEGLPVVWIEGCRYLRAEGVGAARLLRSPDRDLFR